MKTRLPAPLVDLLIDGFSFVLRLDDDGPGTSVSTIREAAAALAGEGSVAAYDTERAGAVLRVLPITSARRPCVCAGDAPVRPRAAPA